MRQVEAEVDRLLTLLRNVIRQRGLTQLEAQQALGWGRSQKSLRLEQVLLILKVIDIDPVEVFAELYGWPGEPRAASGSALAPTVLGRPTNGSGRSRS